LSTSKERIKEMQNHYLHKATRLFDDKTKN